MRTYTHIGVLFIVGALSLDRAYSQHQRLKSLLEETGLKYSLDNAKNFKLRFSLEESRSQEVIIINPTDQIQEEPIVHIFSVGFEGTEVPSDLMQKMLSENRSRKIGNWELMLVGNTIYGFFSIKAPLSALDANLLRILCQVAALTADEFEKEVMGVDN
ncbi:MAG: hypothetical protein KatS3mg025_1888 [Bacteroidia bacterium]|nr:MAG: hypothetical protein KatS3mg025_1888 [Bacteroidia bacterium]